MRRVALIALAALIVALVVALPATGDDDGPYRVRAVFDNGGFIGTDMDVRVAGAKVGSVESVDVSDDEEIVSLEDGPRAIPGKAIVVMRIEDDGFKDFRQDASCEIRPQSLIGERFVDCVPTQPRAPGSEPPPELEEIDEGEPGEGQRLLPVENNGKGVDIDLIQNIQRMPYRDRFRLIINDLGAGLAARGADLGDVIDRANPALRQTNRVLAILAQQNRQLADLAANGDRVLQPLAENRTSITGFLRNAAIAGEATAERGDDLELGLQRLPRTLREVRLTMDDLKLFADRGTPLMADLKLSAADISKTTQKLAPLARAGVPALTTLGDAAESSGPKIVASKPVVDQLADLGGQTAPTSTALSQLLDTFARTSGWQYLMDFVYNSSALVNAFDSFGHFQRAVIQITTCQDLVTTVVSGCEATFIGGSARSAAASAARAELGGSISSGAGAGAVPGESQPPIEELLPELEPLDPDAPDETTTDPDAEEQDTEEGEARQDEQADEVASSARAKRKAARRQLSMSDASLLLSYLLGDAR